MTERHIAHFNLARLRFAPDDPRTAPFLAGREPVRRIAEASPGFLWKQEAGAGEGTVAGDPRMLLSLSVWETPEALKRFVMKTLHKRFLLRRAEWFEPADGPNFVIWWVPAGHRPTHGEARARLAHLAATGETDHAFGWAHLEAGSPAEAPRPVAAE